MTSFLQLDFPALLAAVLAGGTCGLLGSFLVLRREALLGDAITHAVLPGIVVGFALTGLRAGVPMLLGALVAAVLAAWLIGWLVRASRLESGAVTGIVFTSMFALGLVLLEATGARDVDLDVDCVLFGQMETLLWPEARGIASLWDPVALAALPPGLWLLMGVALAVGLVVTWLWRPLRLLCFDAGYAAVLGLPVKRLEMLLNLLVAAAAVAAFEAVGSILVVALLVAPAVAMRFLTQRYAVQVWGGAALGAGVAAAGYLLAGPLPMALGSAVALNAAGVIGVLAGLCVPMAMLFSWRGVRRVA
ncbi:MAG: metal ABC transporter permease [Alphaproteobacteria bacterium]|nr:metal ABC transporter permease [Alphaproteobacteria bacterium]